MSDVSIEQLKTDLAAKRAELIKGGSDLFCDIEIDDGDWGGQQVRIGVTPAAALDLASRLLELVGREAKGVHFHVDKADIATETDHQLAICLRD